MITAHLDWSGQQAQDALSLVLLTGLERATVFLHTQVVQALNVPNTGVRKKSKRRKTKSGRAASYTMYPHPSRPGEPPRKRTGWGQRHVLYSIDRKEGTARIGLATNARYMAWLEVGTARVQARPWLVATVQKHADAAAALMFS